MRSPRLPAGWLLWPWVGPSAGQKGSLGGRGRPSFPHRPVPLPKHLPCPRRAMCRGSGPAWPRCPGPRLSPASACSLLLALGPRADRSPCHTAGSAHACDREARCVVLGRFLVSGQPGAESGTGQPGPAPCSQLACAGWGVSSALLPVPRPFLSSTQSSPVSFSVQVPLGPLCPGTPGWSLHHTSIPREQKNSSCSPPPPGRAPVLLLG